MYAGSAMEDCEIDENDSDGESSFDFWIQLAMTVIVVSVVVFVLFSPKIRVLLEPIIGTGYVSLSIRSIVIGIISILPRLLLM